jgi:dephospho-CoA kinase
MLNVGLTGNVAAGKSTIARWFAEWGATVVDADTLAREAQRPGSPVLAAIAARFGSEVLRPDGALDREALRRRVMGDDDAVAALNAIVHPAVRRRRDALAAEAAVRGDCVLVNDIPLLFEVLDPADFDLVVLVDAPVAVRRQRLMTGRGLSPEEADRLIAAQLPAEGKRPRSDIVLDNGGSLDALRAAAWRAWEAIRARAAAAALAGAGALVAVLAEAADAAPLAGGALARYADAGVPVHLICAAGDEAPVRAAAAALGALEGGALGLAPPFGASDAAGAETVARAVRRVAPAVVLTYGRDGLDGDPDRVAVHRWAWQACRGNEHRPALLCIVPLSRDPGDAAVTLDVRPWRDRKRAALAACRARGAAARLADPEPWIARDREVYVAAESTPRACTDLFAAAPRRPVDSSRGGRIT